MKTHVTRATVVNIAFAVICAIVALSQETGFLQVFPVSWRHWITLVAFGAIWLKSHWNYFVDPQGNVIPLPPPGNNQVQIAPVDKGFK